MFKIVRTSKTQSAAIERKPNESPGRHFARVYGDSAVKEMLATIKGNKRLSTGVLALVMSASFQHQQHYLAEREMGLFGSIVAPLAIDISIIALVRTISTAGMNKIAKVLALIGLVLPLSASGIINFVGSPNRFVGMVFLFLVSLIATIEVVKAFSKPDFKSLLAEEDRVQDATLIGRKRDPKEQAAITAKTLRTRKLNEIRRAKIEELRKIADERGVEWAGVRKPELVKDLLAIVELDLAAAAA